MDDFTGAESDDEDGRGRFLLGGGPALPGVDYSGNWLAARGLTERLNCTLHRLGLRGDSVVFAQPSLTDAGDAAVVIRGTLEGGLVVLAALERMLTAES